MQACIPSLLLRSYQLAYILRQGVVRYHLAYILRQGVDKVAFSGRRSGSWAAAIYEGIPT
jgi:hypothetical protein